MKPDHGVDALHDAGRNQFLGASRSRLFGMLKNQADSARKVLALFHQNLRRTEQHRHMRIMAAGMRHARID